MHDNTHELKVLMLDGCVKVLHCDKPVMFRWQSHRIHHVTEVFTHADINRCGGGLCRATGLNSGTGRASEVLLTTGACAAEELHAFE